MRADNETAEEEEDRRRKAVSASSKDPALAGTQKLNWDSAEVLETIKQQKKRSEALSFTSRPGETTDGDLRLYRLEEVHIRVFLFFSSSRGAGDTQPNKEGLWEKNTGTPAWFHTAVRHKSFQSEQNLLT